MSKLRLLLISVLFLLVLILPNVFADTPLLNLNVCGGSVNSTAVVTKAGSACTATDNGGNDCFYTCTGGSNENVLFFDEAANVSNSTWYMIINISMESDPAQRLGGFLNQTLAGNKLNELNWKAGSSCNLGGRICIGASVGGVDEDIYLHGVDTNFYLKNITWNGSVMTMFNIPERPGQSYTVNFTATGVMDDGDINYFNAMQIGLALGNPVMTFKIGGIGGKIQVFNVTEVAVIIPDTEPPAMDLINLTSECNTQPCTGQIIFNKDGGDLGKLSCDARTNNTKPTIRFTTNRSATLAAGDYGFNLNYTDWIDYNANSEASTTGDTQHIWTQTDDNSTNRTGCHCFSAGTKTGSATEDENLTSTSGLFCINITDPIAPNITLETPSDGAFFILGDNNTNINFTFSGLDNVDPNWTIEFYIDNVLVITNTSFLNGTNTTYLLDVTGVGTHTWYVNSTDSYNNKNQSFIRSFEIRKIANITGLLDGKNGTQRYEYPVRINNADGTVTIIPRIVNITILIDEEIQTCISIDDQINLSCNIGNWSYYLNITELKQDKILNGSRNVNMSEGRMNISIQMDNTSDILYMTINLTGYESSSEFPENIEIDIDHDGKSDVILPGKLRGNIVETNDFIADNLNRSAYNVTFQAGGSFTIVINVTSESDLFNFSIEVSGTDLDAENEFSYTEHFNGTDGSVGFNETLTYQADAPLGVFDDFVSNVSGRWNVDTTSTRVGLSYSSENDDDTLTFSTSSPSTACTSSSHPGTLDYTDVVADFRNSSIIENNLKFTASASCGGNNQGASGSGIASIYVTDGTSQILLKTYTTSCSSSGCSSLSSSGVANFTFKRTSDNYETWELFINGSSQGNKDLGSLDFENKQIKLRYTVSASSGGPCFGGSCSSSTSIALSNFKVSGAWLNRSANNGTYKPTGNITSNVLNVTEKNISRATLTATVYEPDDTGAQFYLSNTCNYTEPIFESVTSGVVHTFNTIGNEICWRATLNSSINITTPVIRIVTVEISPGALTNVSVDFGSDGDIDWIFPDILNSSTSPKVVNGSLSDFSAYRTNNCLNTLVCEYPVTFSAVTGGVLEISKANATVNLNNINLNQTKIVNRSLLNITFSFIRGILELSGIDLNFMGSKNITINVTHNVTTTILENKESSIAWVRFSKYNRSLPYTFTDAIVPYGITTVNSTNVTPFGQTALIPILNITNYAQNAFDIGLRINQTFDCLEVRALNSSNKSLINTVGINLTNTTQGFAGNITKGDSQGIWLFYDLYGCDPDVARSLRLKLEEESCCRNCTRCW